MVQRYGLESYGSIPGLMVGSYEQGNKPAASSEGGGSREVESGFSTDNFVVRPSN
jgi:hypothetical protein